MFRFINLKVNMNLGYTKYDAYSLKVTSKTGELYQFFNPCDFWRWKNLCNIILTDIKLSRLTL